MALGLVFVSKSLRLIFQRPNYPLFLNKFIFRKKILAWRDLAFVSYFEFVFY